MASAEIEQLISALARLPGLGPRSAQRIALELLQKRESRLEPLIAALERTRARIVRCATCGNLDSRDPCSICTDPMRERATFCVVEEIGDLWALERSGAFRGLYHVLGGTLSALDGIGPDDLNIAKLLQRLGPEPSGCEVILALGVTVDGQTTAHYLAERLAPRGVKISRLGQGVPVGGELDYLDEGTLSAALKARQLV